MLLARMALTLLALMFVALPASQAQDDPIVAYARPLLKEPGKPFTLMVTLKVKQGEEKKFEDAFGKALVATRKEKGCLTYDLNRDTEMSTRYVVYERWKSLADLEAHLKTDHIKALREVLGTVIDGQPQPQILLLAGE